MNKLILLGLILSSPVLAQTVTQPAARVRGPLTDGSGTIAVSNASQQVFAATPQRNFLFCMNPTDATEKLAVNIGAAASPSAASWELQAGGSVTFGGGGFMPTAVVSVAAATAGHRFVCKQG